MPDYIAFADKIAADAADAHGLDAFNIGRDGSGILGGVAGGAGIQGGFGDPRGAGDSKLVD